MKIRWKTQAIKDLEAIEDYYLAVAPEFASVLVDEILFRTQRLFIHHYQEELYRKSMI